jgi:hypothetical protein
MCASWLVLEGKIASAGDQKLLWQRLKLLYPHSVMLVAGLTSISSALWLVSRQDKRPVTRGSLSKFAIPAALAFGHREFAWSLWALNGLAATVNAWHADTAKELTIQQREQIEKRLNSFVADIPEFAKESIGMREIFIFPASYFAFVRNDVDVALAIARAGADDPRLAADLVLTVAYLTHLFNGDLSAAAHAYEKVLEVFPNSQWLNKTISKLRSGVDPFLSDDESKQKNCKQLLIMFPMSKKRLIERKICPNVNSREGVNQ